MLGESKPSDEFNDETSNWSPSDWCKLENGQKSRGKPSSEKNKTSKYHIVTLISLCNVQKVFQKWIEIIIHHLKDWIQMAISFLV